MSELPFCLDYDCESRLFKTMIKNIRSNVFFNKYKIEKKEFVCNCCKQKIEKVVWRPIESDLREIKGHEYCAKCFYNFAIDWIKRT